MVSPRLALNQELFGEPLTMVVDKKGKSGVKVLQNGKELSVQEQDDKMIFDFNPYGGSIKISFEEMYRIYLRRINMDVMLEKKISLFAGRVSEAI